MTTRTDATISITNPVRVDWVDLRRVPGLRGAASVGGRLGMTALPTDLAADVPRLAATHRVDTFVLLVEDHELDEARVPGIADAMAAAGIDLVRFPIVDMQVTENRDGLRTVLDDVLARLAAGQSVAVACRGGWGRTGTIVSCLLRDGGLSPQAAIDLTRESRAHTIEREKQETFVAAWDWPDRAVLR